MRFATRPVLLATVLVLFGMPRVEAAFVTLDNPALTFSRPLAGTTTYNVYGSASLDANYVFNYQLLTTQLRNPAFDSILFLDFAPPPTGASNGGVYTGVLFTVNVASTTAIDLYNFAAFGGGSPTYGVGGVNPATGARQDLFANFTITITPASSAVPEPASLAMLGLGLVGFGAVARARRRA